MLPAPVPYYFFFQHCFRSDSNIAFVGTAVFYHQNGINCSGRCHVIVNFPSDASNRFIVSIAGRGGTLSQSFTSFFIFVLGNN